MKKVAFFVEGLTEVLFTEKLINEIFGGAVKTIYGNRLDGLKQIVVKTGNGKSTVLLYDCRGDSCVRSEIDENRDRLVEEGYSAIVGLLDVYPKARKEKNELLRGLYYQTPQKTIATKYVLAVMETESCFLYDINHCEKIDKKLTVDYISSSGVALLDDYEEYDHPAKDLDDIYKLAGKRYKKREGKLKKTINSLDYGKLYLECKTGWVNEYIELINEVIV